MVKHSGEISVAPLGIPSDCHHRWGLQETALGEEPCQGHGKRVGRSDRRHALPRQRVPETPSGQARLKARNTSEDDMDSASISSTGEDRCEGG